MHVEQAALWDWPDSAGELGVRPPGSLRPATSHWAVSEPQQGGPASGPVHLPRRLHPGHCRLLRAAVHTDLEKGLHHVLSGSPLAQRPALGAKWDETEPGHRRLASQPVPRTMLTTPAQL